MTSSTTSTVSGVGGGRALSCARGAPRSSSFSSQVRDEKIDQRGTGTRREKLRSESAMLDPMLPSEFEVFVGTIHWQCRGQDRHGHPRSGAALAEPWQPLFSRWQSPGSLCSRRTPGVPSTSCFCFSPEIFRVGEIPGIPSRLSRIGLSRTRLISPEKCRATSSTSRHWKNAEVRRQAAVPACSVDWSPCAYAAHTADRASRVCRKYSAIALHFCGAR